MDFINAASAGPVADSTISVAHDCGSGDDRWLFVAVPLFSAGETPTVATVTYDGAALSPLVQGEHLYAGNTNVVRAEWWTLDVAAAGKTGSANIVVTLSGAADQLSVIAFTATGSGGPSASVNTAGGNLGVYSVAVNTAAATSRVVGLASLSTDRGVTPGSGNTLIEDVTSATAPPNNILAWVGWEQGTGGSDTWDVTLTSAVRSAAAVIELLEVDIIDVVTASADADGIFDAGGGFSTAFWTLGNASGVGRSAFAHYPAITIPSGATIAFATLVLRHKFTDTKDIDVLVRAADAANPAAPTTGTEALALDRTTAATPVHFGSVVANASVYIDVTAVIRELVDSYDYSSGAAMLILCDDDNSPTIGDFNHLHFLAYDDGATLGPRLIIGYEVEGGGGEIVELAASISVASDAPDSTMLLVTREMVAALSADSAATPVGVLLAVERAFTALMDAAGNTPTVPLAVERALSASAAGTLTTPDDVMLSVAALLAATVAASSGTPEIELSILRALSATLLASGAAPDDVVLSIAGIVLLSALMSAQGETPDDATLAVIRPMLAELDATTSAPDGVAIILSRIFAAEMFATSDTSDTATLLVTRLMVAAILAVSSTPDSVRLLLGEGLTEALFRGMARGHSRKMGR